MLAYQLGAVGTQYASVGFSISWLASSVVAGITSIAGPIIGALFFGLYPELTKTAVEATSISHVPEIVSAALLLLIMAINPGGLASMGRFVRTRATAHADDDAVAAGRDDLEALERAVEAAEDAA
jgi:ABC-type branched-subunit amino acid transport system permease subunit